MTTVSIVVRTLNEAKHLPKLLKGIENQVLASDVHVETILVDSGSSDGTLEIARAGKMKIVEITSEEFSFGRSINKGIEVSTGEYVIIISAHCFPVYNDWIANMILPFSDERVSVVYGMQRAGETNKYSEAQLLKMWFPEASRSLQSHYFCNNANCAIRKSSWLGHRYDELLTGLEDLAWAKEEQKLGGQIDYQADAVIIHVHEESWSQVKNRYYREALALKQIEPSMRFGLFHFSKLFIQSVYKDSKSALAEGRFKEECTNIWRFRFCQFWGTYKGHSSEGKLTFELKQRFYFPNLENRTRAKVPKAQTPPRKTIDYS